MITSIFFVGFLIGNGLAGVYAEVYGRKRVVNVATVGLLCFGMSSSIAPSYTFYLATRLLVGVCAGTTSIAGFLLLSESLGTEYRTFAGTTSSGLFAVGIMLAAGLAASFPHWRLLSIVLTLPIIASVFFNRMVHESPHWLAAKGESYKVHAVLMKIAEVNDPIAADAGEIEIPPIETSSLESSNSTAFKTSDLVTHRILRFRSLAMLYIWFAVSFSFYGLSFNAGNLGGDLYVSVFLSGLSEIPATVIFQWGMQVYGRKPSLSMGLWVAALSYAVCLIVVVPTHCEPEEAACWQKNVRLWSSLIGKGSCSGAFNVIYVFSAELFPTVSRSVAMGLFSQSARIGSILAPEVIWLGNISHSLPFISFGVVVLLAAIISHGFPETKGLPYAETIEDLENTCTGHRLLKEQPSPSASELPETDIDTDTESLLSATDPH